MKKTILLFLLPITFLVTGCPTVQNVEIEQINADKEISIEKEKTKQKELELEKSKIELEIERSKNRE